MGVSQGIVSQVLSKQLTSIELPCVSLMENSALAMQHLCVAQGYHAFCSKVAHEYTYMQLYTHELYHL